MRQVLIICILLSTMAGTPIAASTGWVGWSGLAIGQKSTDQTGDHAVRGIVTKMTPASVHLRRSSKLRRDRELELRVTPATVKVGAIDVGATVSVRYRVEGDAFVATAINAETRTARSSLVP